MTIKPNAKTVVLLLSFVLPACEGFVCSQERIKAIELANRGAESFKNNLYDSAEKDLKQAIQTDPTYAIAYYNLGKVYQKQRKWDKAIENFEEAHGNDQKERAREYLQKFVTNGAKTADGNYVKAANDKLYALSGP